MGEEDEDPDWLRAFQAPSREVVTLSSGSDSSPGNSPSRTHPTTQEEQKKEKEKTSSARTDSRNDVPQLKGKKPTTARRKTRASQTEDAFDKFDQQEQEPAKEDIQDRRTRRLTPGKNMVALSSASDASPGNSPSRAGLASQEESEKDSVYTGTKQDGSQFKGKKPKAAGANTCTNQIEDDLGQQEEGRAEEDIQDKPTGNSVAQRLPLVFPDRVQRSKALVECDGNSIDLSGDIGAVGRIVISNGPSGNQELLLDLKGTVYKSTIVPSRTFCVVSIGQSEAKIEAIMNDFIQLEPVSNLFQAETMVEGTLDGFSFDSDEEGAKVPEPLGRQNDKNDENEDQPKGKAKRKAEKPAGKGQKKAKVAERPSRKGARKTQTAKRTKKSKK